MVLSNEDFTRLLGRFGDAFRPSAALVVVILPRLDRPCSGWEMINGSRERVEAIKADGVGCAMFRAELLQDALFTCCQIVVW